MQALLKNGITIGKAKVIVDIVDKGNPEIRPEYAMNPTAVTIHNTGNDGRGANAESHNKYIHNMGLLSPKDTGYASWHFSVDDKKIYQHIPLNETAWHTGDGSGAKSGNMTSIGIEICENRDLTAAQYKQAEENAIALTCHLIALSRDGITVNSVKPHQAWSGKYCPRVILKRDGSFTKFHNRIKAAYKAGGGKATASKPSASKPKPTTSKLGKEPSNSIGSIKIIADALNLRKEASLQSPVGKVGNKGDEYYVVGQHNGLYALDNGLYCSSNSKYVSFTKKAKPAKAEHVKGTKVQVLAQKLWVYNKPDWNARYKEVNKNEVFTIAKEITVEGSKMYVLKSGLYITANPSFVKVY